MSTGSDFQLAGTGPESYERYIAVFMAPFVDAVIDRTTFAPGDAVLDVACGTGFVAREASGLVGSTGRVASGFPRRDAVRGRHFARFCGRADSLLRPHRHRSRTDTQGWRTRLPAAPGPSIPGSGGYGWSTLHHICHFRNKFNGSSSPYSSSAFSSCGNEAAPPPSIYSIT